jgi:hypothetical protein
MPLIRHPRDPLHEPLASPIHHPPRRHWSIYGMVGLLTSILSLIAWFLVNNVRGQCPEAGSYIQQIQTFHAISFASGLVILVCGLFRLAHHHVGGQRPIYVHMFTILIFGLAILMFYAAYVTFFVPCQKSQKFEVGLRPDMTPADLDRTLAHAMGGQNLTGDFMVGSGPLGGPSYSQNIFAANDGWMIAVHFLDLFNAILFFISTILFANGL